MVVWISRLHRSLWQRSYDASQRVSWQILTWKPSHSMACWCKQVSKWKSIDQLALIINWCSRHIHHINVCGCTGIFRYYHIRHIRIYTKAYQICRNVFTLCQMILYIMNIKNQLSTNADYNRVKGTGKVKSVRVCGLFHFARMQVLLIYTMYILKTVYILQVYKRCKCFQQS